MIYNSLIVKAYPETGRHFLRGNVTMGGIPAKRIVALFSKSTLTLVATTYSDEVTGDWVLSGLPEYPEEDLFIVAFPGIPNYNADIFDAISQGPYPN